MRTTSRAVIIATTAAAVLGTAIGSASAAPTTGSTGGLGADLVAVSNKVSFSCGLNVTNNGPETARSVTVYSPPFGVHPIGDIAPGQTKSYTELCYFNGGVPQRMYAVSATYDPNYSNNGAQTNPPL